ncbi:MAG: P-loop NTPase fold protein, partial [Methylococcales bacterium]|nr:P-loop NTPase fold protein [Methylococcales bacterium]
MKNTVYQPLDDLSQDKMDVTHIAETPDIQPKLKYQPLDDLPHDTPDRLDAAHIAETREVLRSQLEAAIRRNTDKPLCNLVLDIVKAVKQWHKQSDSKLLITFKALLRDYKKPNNPAIRIGLFGGLGQGKTSALMQATNDLNKPRPCYQFWKSENCPVRSYWFDAAHYKADELEYEFDRIFSSWGMWDRSSLIYGVGFLLFLQIIIEFVIASFADSKIAIIVVLRFLPLGLVVATLGFRFLHFWLRDLERGKAFVNQNGALTRLFCRPDIFIVDNLDRANINQQVAILRALYKHSQALSTAFIICMDESSLLQSAITPEHPAKLLRKVINVELRLPARLPQDAPVLCQAILSKSLERNPKLSILDDPVFAGDFATLVSLLPEFSPRIAKRILNDALVDAQKANLLNYAEDCGALLRLHMLYAAFPGLQQASLLLIQILECKEEQEQKRLIAVLSEESKYEQNKLLRLINASHYVQPLAGNWKRLIGVHSHHQTTGGATILIKDSPSIENQKMAQGLWESLNAILHGYGETELWKWYEDYCKNSTEFLPVVIWPMLVVMLAHSEQVEARLRLLRYYQKILTVYESKLSDNKRHAHLHYALLRYWLADHQAFLSLSEQERTDLVANIGTLNDDRKVYLLPIIDPENV